MHNHEIRAAALNFATQLGIAKNIDIPQTADMMAGWIDTGMWPPLQAGSVPAPNPPVPLHAVRDCDPKVAAKAANEAQPDDLDEPAPGEEIATNSAG